MTSVQLQILTVDQLAELLQCADTTVRERATELGGLKFGRDYVFPASAVARRLDELALASSKPAAPPRPSGVLHALPAPEKSRSKARSRPRPALPSLPG